LGSYVISIGWLQFGWFNFLYDVILLHIIFFSKFDGVLFLAYIWKLRFQILEKEDNLALFYAANGYIFNVQRIFNHNIITKQNKKK
jgi:hypothetical protein